MGRPRRKVSDWFDNSEVQVAWARDYLAGPAARLQNTPKLDYYGIKSFLTSCEATADGRELLTNMCAAWRQRQSKAKGDKRTYSYTLSSNAAKRLLDLAKLHEGNKHKALEWLINQDAESRKQAELDRKKALAEKLDELAKSKGVGLTPTQLKDLRWAEKYKAANEILEKQVAALLQENCEQWALLVDLGQDNKRLTKDQQDRALLRYQDLEQVLAGAVGNASRRARKVPVDTTIGGGASPSLFTEDGELTGKPVTQETAEGQSHGPDEPDAEQPPDSNNAAG